MKIFNILLLLVSFVVVGITFYKYRNNRNSKSNIDISSNKYKIILFILFIIAFILLFYKIGDIPYGLHVDEAGMGYDALSISKNGVDRWLYKLPLYFINYGGGQNALYTYIASIFVSIFGLSTLIIRLPAAIIGMIALYYFYKLIKLDGNKTLSLITLSFMVICPFIIMKSRWGLESYLLFPFLIFSLYYLYKAILNNKNKYYIISGLLFGLSLYTYAVSYIIIPLFLLVIFIYLFIIKKINIKNIILFSIPLLILAFPLIYMVFRNAGIISFNINFGIFSVPELWTYRVDEISFFNIFKNIDMFKIILSGDMLYYNCFPYYGTLYYISIPLILFGFIISFCKSIKNIKEKKLDLNVIMIIFGITTLISLMLFNNMNINKANALFIPLIYFIGLGLYYLLINYKLGFKIIGVCFIIDFLLFTKYYFYNYPREKQNVYMFVAYQDFNRALDLAQTKDYNKIYFGNDGTDQTYIYTLFHDKISAYKFMSDAILDGEYVISYGDYVFSIPDDIDLESVYILKSNDTLIDKFKELKFNIIEYNNYVLLYY